MNEPSLSVAVVTPWYGAALTGGAERTAWQIAHGLAGRGHRTTVLTTCARSFTSDWASAAYRPEANDEDGISVRRFTVDARDANAFDRANSVLMGQSPMFYARHAQAIDDDIVSAFITNSINSADLLAMLRAQAHEFDAVIVLPYPYALCIDAIAAAGRRAILIPCLHDEAYAYLPPVAGAVRDAALLAFNTAGERRLAFRLFGPAIALKSFVLGQWVDRAPPATMIPDRISGFDPKGRRYLLYLGRRDAVKNVDMLVESFATFRRRERMSALELVLVGPGRTSHADPRHGIFDLGEVTDAAKSLLLAHAWGVVQPSVNESFSRSVMEAWMAGAPVAVNARCEATADVVLEAGGGWVAATKAQWSNVFHDFDRLMTAERDAAGERGRRYVESQTSRDAILTRLEEAIRSLPRRASGTRYDANPAPALARRLSDGRQTILFAGPLDEFSGVEQLVTGFAFLLSLGIDARLTILGTFDPDESVAERFFDLVGNAGLGDRVLVFESDDPGAASACYRAADLFWSMAEDAPSVAIVDALGYGVPVFALAQPTARETLGSSGLLFAQTQDFRSLAGIAALLLTDRVLHASIIDGQRRRFEVLCREGNYQLAG